MGQGVRGHGAEPEEDGDRSRPYRRQRNVKHGDAARTFLRRPRHRNAGAPRAPIAELGRAPADRGRLRPRLPVPPVRVHLAAAEELRGAPRSDEEGSRESHRRRSFPAGARIRHRGGPERDVSKDAAVGDARGGSVKERRRELFGAEAREQRVWFSHSLCQSRSPEIGHGILVQLRAREISPLFGVFH